MPDNVRQFPKQDRPAFNAILDAFAEDLKPDPMPPLPAEPVQMPDERDMVGD